PFLSGALWRESTAGRGTKPQVIGLRNGSYGDRLCVARPGEGARPEVGSSATCTERFSSPDGERRGHSMIANGAPTTEHSEAPGNEAIDQDPHRLPEASDAFLPCRTAVVASDPLLRGRSDPPAPHQDRLGVAAAQPSPADLTVDDLHA